MIDRLACMFIPDDRRLSLIRNSDRRNIRGFRADLAHRLYRHTKLTGPYLIRIVLHPARLRKYLLELPLRHAADLALCVKKDTAIACRPGIQRHNVLFHPIPPSFSSDYKMHDLLPLLS